MRRVCVPLKAAYTFFNSRPGHKKAIEGQNKEQETGKGEARQPS